MLLKIQTYLTCQEHNRHYTRKLSNMSTFLVYLTAECKIAQHFIKAQKIILHRSIGKKEKN